MGLPLDRVEKVDLLLALIAVWVEKLDLARFNGKLGTHIAKVQVDGAI